METSPKQTAVAVIPIHGEVDEGLQHFVKRAIEDALKEKPHRIVFDIDTWGGRLDAAFEISDAITGIQQCSTSAFVARKAISAGALIALSTNKVYMAPGATIGDCAPIVQTETGPQFLGEKIESPLRARFRALARRSGIPAELAEKMVSKDLSVVTAKDTAGTLHWYSNKTWDELSDSAKGRFHDVRSPIEEGQLLTMDDQEALRWGFSGGTYANMDSLEKAMNWTESRAVEPTWSEGALRWISKYVGVLFMLGLAALYLEYKMPGTGFFGVIGAIFLATALGSQFLLGMASYTALVLALIGILLFALEILVFPGLVFPALAGMGFLLAALVLSLQGFTLPDPQMPWQATLMKRSLFTVIASALGAGVLSMAAVKWLVPHLPLRDGPYLKTTLSDLPDTLPSPDQVLERWLGRTGRAVTALRPVGRIEVEGIELDAVSVAGMVESGQKLVVVGRSGAQLQVQAESRS